MGEKTFQDTVNGIVLTIPISDTEPGPGSIQFKVDSFEEWQEKFLIEDAGLKKFEQGEIGAGTAQDVPSTDRLPEE